MKDCVDSDYSVFFVAQRFFQKNKKKYSVRSK